MSRLARTDPAKKRSVIAPLVIAMVLAVLLGILGSPHAHGFSPDQGPAVASSAAADPDAGAEPAAGCHPGGGCHAALSEGPFVALGRMPQGHAVLLIASFRPGPAPTGPFRPPRSPVHS